jgi:hypothetical protein
MIIVINSNPK